MSETPLGCLIRKAVSCFSFPNKPEQVQMWPSHVWLDKNSQEEPWTGHWRSPGTTSIIYNMLVKSKSPVGGSLLPACLHCWLKIIDLWSTSGLPDYTGWFGLWPTEWKRPFSKLVLASLRWRPTSWWLVMWEWMASQRLWGPWQVYWVLWPFPILAYIFFLLLYCILWIMTTLNKCALWSLISASKYKILCNCWSSGSQRAKDLLQPERDATTKCPLWFWTRPSCSTGRGWGGLEWGLRVKW